jgi:hypothetical protein
MIATLLAWTFAGAWLFTACLAHDRLRKLRASRALCDAQRSALMLEMEETARLRASHVRLLAASASLLAASNELKDAIAPLVIVPPAGGMVA